MVYFSAQQGSVPSMKLCVVGDGQQFDENPWGVHGSTLSLAELRRIIGLSTRP